MNGTLPVGQSAGIVPKMRRCPLTLPPLLVLIASLLPACVGGYAAPPERLELKPGDHVALIGNALADRMQHSGHFETLVVAGAPERELVFRNLAVAGDEVVTRHRSENFGSPDEWLARVKADVVLAFLGFNESFKGPEGLSGFRRDLRPSSGTPGSKTTAGAEPRASCWSRPSPLKSP